MIVDTLKTRLVLHADAVEVFDARQPRRVRFEDLAGLRCKLASNTPITLVLVPKPGLGRKFRVPLLFRPDFAFQAWMRRLEDLDAADQARSWLAVKQNPAYGRDEPERLRRLQWASHVPTGAWVLLTGLFAWSLWSERPPGALLLALALAPCVLLALAGSARGLLRLDDRRNDVRPSLANVWAIACLASLPALLLATNLVAWGAAWAWGSGGGVLMGALAMHWATRTQGSPLHMVVMLPVLCVYCTVALAWLNVQADGTSAHVYRTVVTDKNTHRERVRSYTLRVDPWGPFQEAQRVHVDRERFNTVSPGDTVCMLLHPGRLGWAWYDVAACEQKVGEDPTRQAIERRLRQMAHGPERQGPLLDRWVERFPLSYAALLARGIHRKYQAMALQSAGFVPAMSPRWHTGQYQALQVQDLERSTQLTAKPVLSFVHLMDAAVSPRQDECLRAWLDRGLAADPDSLILRRKYLALLRPMRGYALERLNRMPEALAAFHRAAQLRDRWSQTHLGQIYLHGRGVVPDRSLAAHWLVLAAEAGDEQAKKELRQHPDLSPRPP